MRALETAVVNIAGGDRREWAAAVMCALETAAREHRWRETAEKEQRQ
jgi:hypothetical protein